MFIGSTPSSTNCLIVESDSISLSDPLLALKTIQHSTATYVISVPSTSILCRQMSIDSEGI
ncbi:MAG: hypothetical protein QXN14_03195 [Ignisphaera sp.]